MRTASSLLAVLLVGSAFRSTEAQDPRLSNRLDAPTRKALSAIVDSARAQGIPVEPLMEKVYQGLAMGADGSRIVVAVRSLTFEMGNAHRVLGPSPRRTSSRPPRRRSTPASPPSSWGR